MQSIHHIVILIIWVYCIPWKETHKTKYILLYLVFVKKKNNNSWTYV